MRALMRKALMDTASGTGKSSEGYGAYGPNVTLDRGFYGTQHLQGMNDSKELQDNASENSLGNKLAENKSALENKLAEIQAKTDQDDSQGARTIEEATQFNKLGFDKTGKPFKQDDTENTVYDPDKVPKFVTDAAGNKVPISKITGGVKGGYAGVYSEPDVEAIYKKLNPQPETPQDSNPGILGGIGKAFMGLFGKKNTPTPDVSQVPGSNSSQEEPETDAKDEENDQEETQDYDNMSEGDLFKLAKSGDQQAISIGRQKFGKK